MGQQTVRKSPQEGTDQILPVGETAVDRRGVGAGRFGNRTHGEGALAASVPESAGRFQDTLFQFGVRVARHLESCAVRRFNSIDSVHITAKPCRATGASTPGDPRSWARDITSYKAIGLW